MGDPNTEYPRLERPMLFDDGCALFELCRVAGKDGMGTLRRSRWGGPRSPVRELHGALRLRAHRDIGIAIPTGRHMENHQIQFRCEAKTISPRERGFGFQWCKFW